MPSAFVPPHHIESLTELMNVGKFRREAVQTGHAEPTATSFFVRIETMSGVDQREIELGIVDEKVPEGLHICHIFNDDDERNETLAKFIEKGFDSGEKVAVLMDSIPREELLDVLETAGVDTGQADNHLVARALDVYCPDQKFDPLTMLDRFQLHYKMAIQEGFTGARAVGEMSWALSDEADTELMDLAEYECRLNAVFSDTPCTTICSYDARRFDGGTIMDMLSVHPYTIVRGQLMRNPLYIEPDHFLAELKQRVGAA